MNSGYKFLDDAIVEHLSKSSIHPIYDSALIAKANEELGLPEYTSPAIKDRAWRLIDRRLQALRKAGRIAYVRKGKKWAVR